MANKWQITVDVNKDEFKLLLIGLECLTLERITEGLPTECSKIDDLRAKVKLAWTEREVELVPPPNEWSKHFTHTVDHSTNPL